MISVRQKGDFRNLEKFLKKNKQISFRSILEEYGRKGVDALRLATPVDTGKTANSWSYDVEIKQDEAVITWSNSNAPYGVPVAILIQYGHGTRNGGYVQGIDYINPAMKSIFEDLANKAWKEVTLNG